MPSLKKHIIIASGGTGGHIIPARCLALELAKKANYNVTFFGDKKIKGYVKSGDNFQSKIIFASQFANQVGFKAKISLFFALLKIGLGFVECLILFSISRPNLIVAFGGYATFPILLAAKILRIKYILHEQNAHLGKVHRIFAKNAKKIATSFKETSGISDFDKDKIILVGNLVRKEISKLAKKPYKLPNLAEDDFLENKNRLGYDVILASEIYDFEERENSEKENSDFEDNKLFNILIIGGSGGAKIFSEILPKAFYNLSEEIKEKIKVTQQVRKELLEKTFNSYKKFNINIHIDDFFDNMPKLIDKSHLIIARSGSSSIFEFCAAKKPMILVPFAKAADNHQLKNAKNIEKIGGAILLPESDFTINKITEILSKIIMNEKKLKEMSKNSAKFFNQDGLKNMINLVKKFL
jgi:UDP-N-acetylglucosamine--N-acetylmuramyl-(pentapeptide) pyrophosphoryl-undecaprenol N-acetylglucosamine transferase